MPLSKNGRITIDELTGHQKETPLTEGHPLAISDHAVIGRWHYPIVRLERNRKKAGSKINEGSNREWLATLDARTRHSHRQLGGERREVGEKFSNGCRYPGDPQAPYAEVCNCRCTLVAAVDGVDQSQADRWSKLPEGMTHQEWKAGYAERPSYDSSGRTMGGFFELPSVKTQLEKRGMTEAQGQKALSAQLKRSGTSGHAFRTMQKAEQQRYWRWALAKQARRGAHG